MPRRDFRNGNTTRCTHFPHLHPEVPAPARWVYFTSPPRQEPYRMVASHRFALGLRLAPVAVRLEHGRRNSRVARRG